MEFHEPYLPPLSPPPLPVVSIEYERPGAGTTKPGGLVAIGIISIALAAFGFLTNGFSLLTTLRLHAILTPRAYVAPPPPAPSSLPPYNGDLIAARGLARVDRANFIANVHETSMNPDRLAMLDRLLGEFGREIVPSKQYVTSITETGHLPAGPDGVHTAGTTFIRTRDGELWGELWINNASAGYQRTADGATYTVEQDVATDTAQRTARSSVAVAEEIDVLHAKLGSAFNTTQAAVVAHDLLSFGPRYGKNARMDGQFPSANGGSVLDPMQTPTMIGSTFAFGRSPQVYILANGAKVVNPNNVDPTTGIPYPPPVPVPRSPYTPRLVAAMASEAGVSLLLALLLLVAGIRMLTGSANAASLHVLWAWLKLPAVVFTCFITMGTVARMAAMTNSATWVGFLIGYVAVILLQLAYPIVVLFALPSRRNRDYFAKLGGSVSVFSDQLREKWGPAIRTWIASTFGRACFGVLLLVSFALAAYHVVGISHANNDASASVFNGSVFHAIGISVSLLTAVVSIAAWTIRSRKTGVQS